MPIRPISEIKTKILSSSRVLKAIDHEITLKMENNNISIDKARNLVKAEAEKLIG